ncbi:MAG: RcpC/CpaB family pilus assembly protein [Elusimicrobia bacterium]|nr:RcpC/CpaB family pilus assembly protein [Elusimicrobiota bacterium]
MRSLLLAAALFAVPAALHAETQHLSISVADYPLDKFLETLSQQTKANFIVAEGVQDRRVSLSFKNAPVKEVLDQLRQSKGLSYQELGPNLYLLANKPLSLDGARALDGYAVFGATLTIRARQAPLQGLFDQIGGQTKTNFSLAEGLEGSRATLLLKKVTARQAVQVLCAIKGLTVNITGSGSFIVRPVNPAPAAGARRLPDSRPLVVRDTPNPGQVDIAAGERFLIELPGNLKSPYEWVVAEIDPGMVSVGQTIMTAKKGDPDGYATWVFPFQALKPGGTSVLLEYRNAREKEAPIKTFKLAVTVSEGAAAAAAAAEPEQKAPPMKADPQGIFTGYRGVSLSLPGHQLAFLKKGDHVDVMVTFDAKLADNRKEKVTATILQNVRIVDISKPAKGEERGTIQILLNPNEAQYAALSDAQGDLHVALRAPGDVEMHPMEMASFRKLFR